MELLTNPWGDRFYELVFETKSNLKIISPYIKEQVVGKTIERLNSNCSLQVLTQCSQRNLVSGALDATALCSLLDRGATLRSNLSLHAKIFLFDKSIAVVTSANLTNGGLFSNTEVGVLFEKPEEVNRVVAVANNIFDSDTSYCLSLNRIVEAEELANKIKENMADLDEYLLRPISDRGGLATNSELVAKNLSGWRKSIFEIVAETTGQHFDLQTMYAHAGALALRYPNNRHIKDKIRQQLQELREIGLIEFLGDGRYKKIW